MGDSVLGVGRTQWGLIVSWMWGVKESVESKLTPGFGLSEEEVSIKQDNARKYRHLLFSHQVLSDCLQPQGLQHAVSYHVLEFALSHVLWVGDAILTISSSAALFSFCLPSFPVPGSFPISLLFTSGSQSIGASASSTVLPMNTQGWFTLRMTDLISLHSKGKVIVQSNSSYHIAKRGSHKGCWEVRGDHSSSSQNQPRQNHHARLLWLLIWLLFTCHIHWK